MENVMAEKHVPVVTKASLEMIATSLEKSIVGLKVDQREATRKVVVLSLTQAEPKRIAEAKLVETKAKSALRKALMDLALLRESIALAM